MCRILFREQRIFTKHKTNYQICHRMNTQVNHSSIPTSLTNFEWCNLINAHDITNTEAQLGDVVDKKGKSQLLKQSFSSKSPQFS